jgi:hypothetical protein
MPMTDTPVHNGVNVQALLDARGALSQAPEAAQFKWRVSCEWKRGTRSVSTVEGYFSLGEEHTHKTSHSFDSDLPETFASEDIGTNATEFALVGPQIGALLTDP